MSQTHPKQRRPTESVWDYPRPPRVVPDARRVTVHHAGVDLADSRRCVRVLETSHPPVFYVPRHDVRMDLLTPTAGSTHCEWKGEATYWTLTVLGRTVDNAAWSYEEPDPAYAALTGHLAFYPGRVDSCTVGGERVLPQPGGFYGGWITDEIIGPFKGLPGSAGW
ncbi:DUF427 domain-containing protein [Streptomyces venezuelae]|uniref:DUF427 domain-containing protein n=1 Tax=Streptomyces venezuelae TaxID=54571 RepID=UPI00278C830D|nr:DUF427 domain-containing protein [Streptomyces venezuelae]